MKFHGPILENYDITEYTTVGHALYNVGLLEDVKLFLEVGTQVGGSARCIATGLSQSNGHLHTIEAVESRAIEARKNLDGLPVTCHWSSTGNSDGLRIYYNGFSDQIQEPDNLLDKLLLENEFDAVFLDSCIETQQKELEACVERDIKYILMHEPDDKCPSYELFMENKNYKLTASGRDKIRHNNPLWVRFDHE